MQSYRLWLIIGICVGLFIGCSIWNGSEYGHWKSGEYVVKLTGDVDIALQVLEDCGIKIIDRVKLIEVLLCKLTESEAEFLQTLKVVEYVEKNNYVYALAIPEPRGLWEFLASPSSGLLDLAAGEVIPGGVKRVGASEIWDQTTGLDGVTLEPIKVAVLDTGISTNVADLVGAVAGGYNAIKNNDEWEDDNNHGTYISSVIAARKNGYGIVGVMPDAELYAVKVLDSRGIGSYFNLIRGLEWISEQEDISVVNISLGGYSHSQAFKDAVAKCAEMGIGCIAAAGNDGDKSYGNKLSFPANYALCVSVGAVDADGNRAPFSNYGDALMANGVMAPGVNVPAYDRNGTIRYVSGTSLSTPFVTGAVVMLLSKKWCTRRFIFQGSDKNIEPDIYNGHGIISYPHILDVLYRTASDLGMNEIPGAIDSSGKATRIW